MKNINSYPSPTQGKYKIEEIHPRFPALYLNLKEIHPRFPARYLYENGDTYRGAMCLDVRQGWGIYIYKDRTMYAGEFKDGKRHGKGEMTDRHGCRSGLITFVDDRGICVHNDSLIPPASTTGKNILSILVNSIRKFKKFLK